MVIRFQWELMPYVIQFSKKLSNSRTIKFALKEENVYQKHIIDMTDVHSVHEEQKSLNWQ